MNTSSRLGMGTAAAALAVSLVLGGIAAWAQTAQEHDAHHPDGAAPQAAPAPAPVPGPAQQRGMPGMMAGQGMPMQGPPGANPPGGTPGMMGDMSRMMQMMHRQMVAQHAMRPFERIEGQLAFYRAELRVTDAQRPQWDAFADAVRAAAGTLRQAARRPRRSRWSAASPCLPPRPRRCARCRWRRAPSTPPCPTSSGGRPTP